MASVAVLFGRKKIGKIDTLLLDAVLSESHDYTNEVTEFPIETGATITDNIRITPNKIKIEGMVTNSPVEVSLTNNEFSEIVERNGTQNSAKRVSRDGVPTFVESAQDILLRIQGRSINGFDTEPELVEVVTGLRVYYNMAMKNLKIDRRASTGQALVFTADFIEVQTVESQTVAIPFPQPAVKDKTTSKTSKGNQNSKDTKDSENKSLQFAALEWLGKVFTGGN